MDYYYAKNEGHIIYGLINNSNEVLSFVESDRILQGIIMQYFTVDDDTVDTVRTGGIGSTN